MAKRAAYIRSMGRFLPERKLTNRDLEQMVDTTDEWITTRTGIRERRILYPGLGSSHMAVQAARECLERAGVGAEEVDDHRRHGNSRHVLPVNRMPRAK